ncbi:hypothetical protein VPH35_042179 [Triticum aestivum]
MAGTSRKSKQDGPAGSSHDDLASHGNEEHQAQPRSSAPITGYKRMRTKAVVSRGKRPDDIISNENSNESQTADAGNKNVEGADVEQPPKAKRQKTGGTEGRRNRASPARLFKLNKDLVPDQKGVIIGKEFGGILDLAASSMPGDFSQWIMKHYDPEILQIVIPERAKIPVDAASVRRIWGLPNRGRKLLYLDSLDVNEPIPNLVPRVSVWNSDLISRVVKKDRKAPGEYGQLRGARQMVDHHEEASAEMGGKDGTEGNEDNDDDEEEEDDEKEDDEGKEDDDDKEGDGDDKDKEDDGQGKQDEDDEDDSGGGNSGSGSNGGSDRDGDPAAENASSDDDEQCTLQFLIEKKRDRKAKGLDEADRISVRDLAYRAENPGYGQGGKSRQSAMKKYGPPQQQQQTFSETKEAIHGNAKTQVVKSTPSSSAAPPCSKVEDEVVPTGVDSKQSDLPEAVTMGKSPEQKLLRALGKLPVCSTILAQPEATSVPEAVEATGQGNTSHFSHVEERYHEFMRVSGKTTNALEINVLDVSELFASVRVIEYGKYFVTVRELANSMKKEGFVLSHVMEVGIQNIMMNLPPDSKKLVMPVKFSVQMLNMELNGKELISRFKKSNRLDRKDMIMFLVLENIDKKKPKTGNHYWIFNVNIRDRRYETLDSWRTLKKQVFRCLRKENGCKFSVSMGRALRQFPRLAG